MTRATRLPRFVRPATGEAGLTALELLFVLSLGAVLAAIAVPEVSHGLDEARTSAAARYLSSRLYQARMEAIKRSTRVGYRFVEDGDDFRFAPYGDGNNNGIRTADILAGVDWRLEPDDRLSWKFGAVRFGLLPGVPLIDGSVAGGDPIRLGSSNILTFSPNGTCSSGSLYLRGARQAQYAVQIFGVTGRTRVFKFVPGVSAWRPL